MSDTSGPAFPMTGMTVHGGQPIQSVYQNGMTLRDYFAAKAMHAILAAQFSNPVWMGEKIPKAAYEMADAMLAERAK